MSDGDASLLPPSPGLDPTQHLPDPLIPVGSQEQVWRQLIARTVPRDELPSTIEAILSGREINVVDLLTGSDAQAFIDIMDEVRYRTPHFREMADLVPSLLRSFVQALNELDLTSRIRKKCVRVLYKICARNALFPRSLRIELRDNRDNIVLYRGGFGDVSKREYQGREVAVKRLRIYDTSNLQKVIRVGR